jgi:enoyl-CoA hydratase/carnithine racemase
MPHIQKSNGDLDAETVRVEPPDAQGSASPPGGGDHSEPLLRSMLPSQLVATRQGSIALLRLSRPAKRNALDRESISGIETFFKSLPDDIHVVILHGEGEHFSAGADLSEVEGMFEARDASISGHIRFSQSWHRAFDLIENCPVPVVAVLHGAVIGGGLELAATAHIRIAERGAFYALPEGARGLFIGGSGAVRIPRLIGTPRVVDMMLTGRTYDAEEGQKAGLSQYIVEPGQGLAKAYELSAKIIANSPLSNFAITQALPRIARSEPDAGLFMESLMAGITFNDAQAKERVRTFLDKRAARISPVKDVE